jgi:hypothetical protein
VPKLLETQNPVSLRPEQPRARAPPRI